MIHYNKFTLQNGLRVILHCVPSTPLVSVNILYCVGAKDENPEKTGFAHLFEHLMFSGSKNFPSFDKVIEENGGESNAFTNNDFTNFYLTLPSDRLEVGLALERDRMENLIISQEKLDVQKSVVCEEYKQRYLNQPYGDVWLLLRELSYTTHPYRWSTIGKDISHIEKATLEDVVAFYNRYYIPQNAILCISGNIDQNKAKELVQKYFSNLEKGKGITAVRSIPKEPEQTQARTKSVKRDVPQRALYVSFPMPRKRDIGYYACDLLSDLLSLGHSSRMYNTLVKEQNLFTVVNAFISGDEDEGLFVMSAKCRDEVSFDRAEKALFAELEKVANEDIYAEEFQKVKNKYEATFTVSLLKALDRAMILCYYEYLGDIDLINKEVDNYQGLQIKDVQAWAKNIFQKKKSNTLYYDKI